MKERCELGTGRPNEDETIMVRLSHTDGGCLGRQSIWMLGRVGWVVLFSYCAGYFIFKRYPNVYPERMGDGGVYSNKSTGDTLGTFLSHARLPYIGCFSTNLFCARDVPCINNNCQAVG